MQPGARGSTSGTPLTRAGRLLPFDLQPVVQIQFADCPAEGRLDAVRQVAARVGLLVKQKFQWF